MEVASILLLLLTSLTGLLLLVLRATPAMGVLLAIHLGVVLGLFLTLPCGKFVHAVYRFAVVVRCRLESRRGGPVVIPEASAASGGKRLAPRTAHRSSPITLDGP